MTAVEHLCALLEHAPAEGLIQVPIPWLRELIDGERRDEVAEVDLTVEQVAELFGRSPVTVKRWLQSHQLRGYKLGGEWRVPRGAVREFQEAQR